MSYSTSKTGDAASQDQTYPNPKSLLFTREQMMDPHGQIEAKAVLGNDSDSDGNFGRWTSKEHEAFLEGFKLYPRDWRRIANFMGTRNNIQVRTHAQKYFRKSAQSSQYLNKQVGGKLFNHPQQSNPLFRNTQVNDIHFPHSNTMLPSTNIYHKFGLPYLPPLEFVMQHRGLIFS
jgi:SHAQKYF class myb-like DNA-binding protein